MIREILRTRDNREIILRQKCKFATVPTRRHTTGSAWVSKAITLRRKNSTPRHKTPILAADRGGGGLERKEGSVVVPTEPVPLSLEVCGGDGGDVKVLS
ncbi:hypothetical protein L3X38_035824 [Prunus dulcis]|uniref:Uncharacterized protein n=1 Tax=Prunus dulcis TaxID=3755 RepID=A0AAD4VKE8_PRUDU|nr:hypothetical protein L3X38_035824 [Prunus dulcis]